MFERLTDRTGNGQVYLIEGPEEDMYGYYTGKGLKQIEKVIDRLAAYEDTGLSPEQVQELAEAKGDGRLVELPVKVGDTIYFPDHYNKRVDSRLITGIRQNTSGTWQVIGGLLCFPFSKFGVSIFLTREAAEKALEVGK